MRDLVFKSTRPRHPSKKLRFVYNYLRLQTKPSFFLRPKSSRSSFARFQILRKMFVWFYSDRFARRHVFNRLIKTKVNSYASFLAFCTKLETLVPVVLYRFHFVSHLKQAFSTVNSGFVLKNGQKVLSIFAIMRLGDFIELPFYQTFFQLTKMGFFLNNEVILRKQFVNFGHLELLFNHQFFLQDNFFITQYDMTSFDQTFIQTFPVSEKVDGTLEHTRIYRKIPAFYIFYESLESRSVLPRLILPHRSPIVDWVDDTTENKSSDLRLRISRPVHDARGNYFFEQEVPWVAKHNAFYTLPGDYNSLWQDYFLFGEMLKADTRTKPASFVEHKLLKQRTL